jgi:hypothetical protein
MKLIYLTTKTPTLGQAKIKKGYGVYTERAKIRLVIRI